jgi:2-dehydro-3-deoxygalactonokinase
MAERPTSRDKTWTSAIALDGGTTNTRARLLRNGTIVAVARRSVGARDTLLGRPDGRGVAEPSGDLPTGTARLADAIRQVIEEVVERGGSIDSRGDSGRGRAPDLIVAAGMLSSDVGLINVPHVLAPAGINELARAVKQVQLSQICDVPIQFIPGVRTPASEGPDGWLDADVMRGEECETIGAVLALSEHGQLDPGAEHAFLWPGSHTKLVEVDGLGRITRSQTSLAGELLQAVSRHTLLVASLPETLPDELDRDVIELAARVVNEQGFGRAAFLVRISALTKSLDAAQRASFLIGAVVADDVAHLASHPIAARGGSIWVGGREPLRSLYAEWLGRRHSGPVVPLEEPLAESASALGSLAIAAQSIFMLENG